jgi:predicted nucleic acid-binding protein
MRYELLRRERLLVLNGRLTPQKAAALVQEGFRVADLALTIVPNHFIEPLQTEAMWRIPQDPDDWPSVALALALDAGIWTEDRDFFGSGLATWTTPVLDHYLTAESA